MEKREQIEPCDDCRKTSSVIAEKIKESQRTSMFSIISSTILATIKWITGIVGNSYAVIADAIESTADIFSSIIVLFANKYAVKPPDENHPYGHGKVEAVATFVVVGFLLASAVMIAIQSIGNIMHPTEKPKAFTLIIVGAVIIWKEISYQIVIRKARKIGSTSLVADAWHHRSDAITSIAAFIGISLSLFLGYHAADSWAALLASGFIVYNSYLIVKPALNEIMDKDIYKDQRIEFKSEALKCDGVRGIEKCIIRKSGMFYIVDIHVEVDRNESVEKGHHTAHCVKLRLIEKFPEVLDVNTHIEPYYDK